MESQTITKKQAKTTLSGKKKKTEVIKNVLAKPFSNYWPAISPEDNNNLHEVLTKFLPKVAITKPVIPYESIRNVPRHERRKFRESFVHEGLPASSTNDKKKLVFGINDVTKLLENQEAGAVLLEENVQPRILIQHIVEHAVLYNVPVLVVKGLKEVCKKKCGIAGAAIAIHKSVSPESELGLIQQTVYNIHENYPIPQNHIHSDRGRISTITIPDSEDGKSVGSSDEEENTNYHLGALGEGQRAFVPPKTEEVVAFIDLDTDTSMNLATPSLKKTEARYRALSVKRLKGDKNRNKRKMKNFNKKTK